MTNQSYASETTRRNIPWAEVASLFHLEHLGEKHTVEPVMENKKPPEEVSDAELVASLNRVYNPDVGEAVISEAERAPISVGTEQSRLPDYPDEYEIGSGWLYVRKTNGKVEQVVRLCNFFPRVKAEIVCDDGIREDRMFRKGIVPSYRLRVRIHVGRAGEDTAHDPVRDLGFELLPWRDGQILRLFQIRLHVREDQFSVLSALLIPDLCRQEIAVPGPRVRFRTENGGEGRGHAVLA